uniref:tetratricopeptide repeat protein n=1 Tax=uncultured Tenacibaculum sp. TaxID=174713 RepID=UPI00262EAAAF|nr:tetratricopeptide repeat protein [uncultured Tenacibaculum sp.]
MRIPLFLTIAILLSTTVYSQTNYDRGFNNGYKKGYCHDQGIGCIDPIPPIPPIPKIGESSDNYNDGYDRGFEMGLQARKSSNSSSSSENRTRYKTSSPEFIDYVYKPNYELQFALVTNIMKGLEEAQKEFKNENYDNTIFICRKVLAVMPDQLMANQLTSMSFLAKYNLSKNPLTLIEAYNFAIKSDRLNGGNELSKITNEKMNELVIEYLKNDDFSSIAGITSRVNYNNNFTNYWNGISYYYQKDYKNAKKYLKKVKGFEPAEQYLESIKNKKYYSNPYSKQNQANNKNENSSNDNQFLSEVQKMYQRKEFDKLIDKLKPIEEKIRQKAITDKQTLFFTYSLLAYSHYNKENLAETIKYSTLAIDNSVTNQNGDLYFLRGISKSNIGDYFGSNKDYDYLLENYKKINYDTNNLATLYNNKAYNLVLLKKYKESKPLIDKALSLDKNTDYIWGTKGELEYYLGNYSDAVNAMSKSIKINPTSNSYYYRGLAKIKLGNKESGCSDLSKAGEMGESKAYSAIKKNCN